MDPRLERNRTNSHSRAMPDLGEVDLRSKDIGEGLSLRTVPRKGLQLLYVALLVDLRSKGLGEGLSYFEDCSPQGSPAFVCGVVRSISPQNSKPQSC